MLIAGLRRVGSVLIFIIIRGVGLLVGLGRGEVLGVDGMVALGMKDLLDVIGLLLKRRGELRFDMTSGGRP